MLIQPKILTPLKSLKTISRKRLLDKLNRGLEKKLTLVSAPAGYGKTTLLTDWVNTSFPDGFSAAWISLDALDNNRSRFWGYILASIYQVKYADYPIEEKLPELTSEGTIAEEVNQLIADSPADFVLILDDFHLITEPGILHDLAYLLEFLPRKMHVVISARSDPTLSLARLRALDQMTELRFTDLQFNQSEARLFFRQATEVRLSPMSVDALNDRAEGWAAGLQLAARAIEYQPDVQKFVHEFNGNNRLISDFFAEQVWEHHGAVIHDFLIKTSILNRLTDPICEILTGKNKTAITLQQLELSDLFLVPLDEDRTWYRYHGLFLDYLRARLKEGRQQDLISLHLSAAAWLERNGEIQEANYHYLSAREFSDAAIEPLSEREMQILQRIASGMTYEEIASELILAVGTVQSYVKSLYLKLGVHSGLQAVARARQLSLLL